ncbi:MAG: hypothetical protein CW346_18205 [Bacillaceae bacterium]|nr:hypothetical protein [Bacillaceae bacterium]
MQNSQRIELYVGKGLLFLICQTWILPVGSIGKGHAPVRLFPLCPSWRGPTPSAVLRIFDPEKVNERRAFPDPDAPARLRTPYASLSWHLEKKNEKMEKKCIDSRCVLII